MTREEKEQTGKYVLKMARLLEDGCYQQEMLLKAAYIIYEALEQEPVLDKIRAEIKKSSHGKWYVGRLDGKTEEVLLLDEVLQIIDKYRARSEPQESEET